MSQLLVVAGLYRDGPRGKYLAQRRPRDHARYAGRLEFPGGQVDDGETMQAALIREWGEELGVNIQVGKMLGEYVLTQPPTALVVLFDVTHMYGTPSPQDGQKIEWMQLWEIKKELEEDTGAGSVPSMDWFTEVAKTLEIERRK